MGRRRTRLRALGSSSPSPGSAWRRRGRAGHGIGLGDPVHGERPPLQLRLDLCWGGESEAVIDEMLIDIVGQYPDILVLEQNGGQRLDLVARIGGAGRVRRR